MLHWSIAFQLLWDSDIKAGGFEKYAGESKNRVIRATLIYFQLFRLRQYWNIFIKDESKSEFRLVPCPLIHTPASTIALLPCSVNGRGRSSGSRRGGYWSLFGWEAVAVRMQRHHGLEVKQRQETGFKQDRSKTWLLTECGVWREGDFPLCFLAWAKCVRVSFSPAEYKLILNHPNGWYGAVGCMNVEWEEKPHWK